MWAPKIMARERILAMGVAGSGKSTAPIDIALKIPEITMFVVDTDRAWWPGGGRMNPGEEVGNIVALPALDFGEMKKAVREASRRGGVDDWLVVDMHSPQAWDWAQEWYTEATKGKEIEDFWLDFMTKKSAQKDPSKGEKNPFGGDTDWVAIKKLYAALLSDVLNFPGHVYLTAGVKAIGDRDTKEVRELFGWLGVRPDGEKKLAHVPSTILLFRQVSRESWTITTVKDRNGRVGPKREYVENLEWTDFAKGYLWNVAGWRPGR